MAEKKEKLFEQFPPVTTEEWRAKVETDLKGAPFEKKLVWRTNEGFNVQPMYRAEDIESFLTTNSVPGEYPYIRGVKDSNNWLSRQEIVADTPEEANAKALEVVTKGVNSLGFLVKAPTVMEIATLLNGIDFETVEVNFRSCPKKSVDLVKSLVEYLKQTGKTEIFHGSVDFNPFKKTLKHGQPAAPETADTIAEILNLVKDVPGLKVLSVDSDMFCNGGAFIYQELGYALSWGAEYLTILTENGVSADDVASRIKFNMGISSNYFMELAKFRAARMLWAQIVKQYNPSKEDSCKMHAHASTSKYNQTIFDAHVNLLRSQTECMSAALAGVDSITVVPFDTPYKIPDDFSERIARNQQFLLKEESHLDKVVDPAGGSYYVETLTKAIAEQAWKLFLEIDDKGGFMSCINDGSIQKSVRESSEKRHTDVARRKEILLGTNQYPNINEFAADKIKTTGCGCGCKHADEDGEGLPTARAASDFEALRLQTEAASNRPKVFMLTIGNLAMRLARAQFSTNFFGCAGYEIVDNLGFKTVQEGIDAALKVDADVVVLCSSDDEYATFAPEAYEYLNGRAQFVVAGAPACSDDLRAIGITNFVNVRSNVLETLRMFNSILLK